MNKYKGKLLRKLNYFFFNQVSANDFTFSLKIDINKINFFLKLKDTLDKKNFIWSGDWDKKKIDISQYRLHSPNYNSIFQVYKENKEYTDCDEFKIKAKLLLNEKKSSRAQNMQELHDYFKSIDILKSSLLKKSGYKSQAELGSDYINDEIGVVISKNSEILKLEDKFGGTHRFALCKVFNIKQIIVSIKAIHESLLDKDDLKRNIDNETNIINLIKNRVKL
jgi:hypothetical protein